MRTLVSILAILAGPTWAGDFRGSDFGESCAEVKAQELSIGSKFETTFNKDPESLHFRGNAFGREVVFTNLCPRGLLSGGSDAFRIEPLQAARESYAKIFREIVQTYGAPFDDNSPGRKSPYPAMPDPAEFNYMTSWKTPRVFITIGIWKAESEEPDTWRVIVSYMDPAEQAKSKTSAEPARER